MNGKTRQISASAFPCLKYDPQLLTAVELQQSMGRKNAETNKRNSLMRLNKAFIEVRMTCLSLFHHVPCQIEQGLSNISVSVSSKAKNHKHRPRSASATASQIDPRFLSVETKRRRESVDSPNTRCKL